MEEDPPRELTEREAASWNTKWGGFVQELKNVSYIAAPMVTVSVLQYLLQVVSVIMVGHLGRLTLSSVAIATSLTTVTGFSLLSGLVGGLETLCGQAYGAKQYDKLESIHIAPLNPKLKPDCGSGLKRFAGRLMARSNTTSSESMRNIFTSSVDAFRAMWPFFRLALPSAVMVCLTISTLHLAISYGFGAAASTRVSNELGAGNPHKAQRAVLAVMFLSITETISTSIVLFSCRHILGWAYSNEKQVVNYVAVMTPLICASMVTDSLQTAISGVARGSGWQHIGAYVNLGAFYIVGIPVAVVLGFVEHLKAKGFWIGIVIGSILQLAILSVITGFTDWQKQGKDNSDRIIRSKCIKKIHLRKVCWAYLGVEAVAVGSGSSGGGGGVGAGAAAKAEGSGQKWRQLA
ncbi:UNVERIFIED_CONTAM: protein DETOXIFICATION 1 [Sesamum radiatum]|uniref:Protein DETOXIFICATION 1 n=1 Tax=Sesamum radiatum TaxID=300843 RepID=A0AAW2V3X0_SESRA